MRDSQIGLVYVTCVDLILFFNADALIESARTYIERCLNAGAITLTHLDRIEEKMLEDFGYSSFNMMGYGRFIEFLLLEIKQV
jgi:hypothetical protein